MKWHYYEGQWFALEQGKLIVNEDPKLDGAYNVSREADVDLERLMEGLSELFGIPIGYSHIV